MDQDKMGKFIAKRRKELHLTQAQLGEMVGVTDKTVSKWEKGNNAPNISILNSLSEILGVSTKELLKGEKESNLEENNNGNKEEINIEDIVTYYVDIDKKKYKRNFILYFIITLLLFICMISIFVLGNNYNNCFVYDISSTDDGFSINGIIVLTSEEDYLSINSINNISRYDLDDIDVYSYEYTLFSNDTVLYTMGNISEDDDYQNSLKLNDIINGISIYINEKSDYDLILNNEIIFNNELTIRIKYIDKSKKENQLTIPLKLNQTFSNNKVIYKSSKKY